MAAKRVRSPKGRAAGLTSCADPPSKESHWLPPPFGSFRPALPHRHRPRSRTLSVERAAHSTDPDGCRGRVVSAPIARRGHSAHVRAWSCQGRCLRRGAHWHVCGHRCDPPRRCRHGRHRNRGWQRGDRHDHRGDRSPTRLDGAQAAPGGARPRCSTPQVHGPTRPDGTTKGRSVRTRHRSGQRQAARHLRSRCLARSFPQA